MAKNHIMLDLETLSTRKDAAIIQLAAVAFDPETGEFGSSINAFIRNPSGHVDVQTVAWWMQRKAAATVGAGVASEDALSETEALSAFRAWLAHVEATEGKVEALWSHGATFDIVLVDAAYTRHGGSKPWSYKVERDTRTLYALAPGGMPAVEVDTAREHDARYDCERQVAQVVGALRALRQVEKDRDMWREEFRVTEEARAAFAAACGQGATEDVPDLRVSEVVPDTERAYDPPPVWSNAEARCEGEANPCDRPPPSSDANVPREGPPPSSDWSSVPGHL